MSHLDNLSASTHDSSIVRRRVVAVRDSAIEELKRRAARFAVLRTESPSHRTIALHLFEDATFTGILERVELSASGIESWSGRIASGEDSSGVFALQRDGSSLTGTIRVPGSGLFELRPWKDSTVILQIDLTTLHQGLPPQVPPEDPPKNQPNKGKDFGVPNSLPPISARARMTTADGSMIDVLVAYTPAARDAAAREEGLGAGSRRPIERQIEQALSEANVSLINSKINTRFRLVRVLPVAYIEPTLGKGEAKLILDALSSGRDFEEARAERDRTRADIVALFVVSPIEAGLSFTMTSEWLLPKFASYAFSVIEWRDAVRNLNLAHELGHVMGAQHDRANATGTPGAFTYSYGWPFHALNRDYHDIMSYRQSAQSQTITYYANPEVRYPAGSTGAVPTGIRRGSPNEADVAATLNSTRTLVASFR